MAVKFSTGARTKLLSDSSLASMFADGTIKVYTGPVPASADDAVSGTLLCTISLNSTGTGITFDPATGGVLPKAVAEVWSGVNVASGVARYFRHVAPGDTGGSSTAQPRIQGTIGTVGDDMNFSSTNLTSGATQTIDYYNVVMPTY
jgi:hypothetical protein